VLLLDGTVPSAPGSWDLLRLVSEHWFLALAFCREMSRLRSASDLGAAGVNTTLVLPDVSDDVPDSAVNVSQTLYPYSYTATP